jgi:hypothetical protein
VNDTYPELPKLAEGSRIIVIEGGWNRTHEYDAVVTKVARVWITAEQDTAQLPRHRREWRLRMDDQTDGGDHAHFYTPEQWAWKKRDAAAREYLDEELGRAGTVRSSRWANDPVTLANIIRKHEGLEPL